MSSINWYEIPVTDMDRAQAFYEAIFATKLIPMNIGFPMAMFPSDDGPTGALVQGDMYVPSDGVGCRVYLNGGNDLQDVLDRVEAAGGSVHTPKYSIGENGNVGFLIDTEGNNIGLHSPN